MTWFYFYRNKDTLIYGEDIKHEKRPSDANSDNGDPHTPWYQKSDHFDEFHVHVQAKSYHEAVMKALKLIQHP